MINKPTYGLGTIKSMVRDGQYHITSSALQGAFTIGLDEDDIITAVLGLECGDLYKTMQSIAVPGLWQDVYHIRYNGYLLYIKLQISISAIVISFKEK